MQTAHPVERIALSPQEAAEALGVSRDTVDRMIAKGWLRSFTIGRRRFITANELNRFVRSREEAAGLGPTSQESHK
jgi:excisionase family DNA binding protein